MQLGPPATTRHSIVASMQNKLFIITFRNYVFERSSIPSELSSFLWSTWPCTGRGSGGPCPLDFVVVYSLCTRWAESSKTFNNSMIQLHKILKFGSFVVLLDPLTKSFHSNALYNICSQSKISPLYFLLWSLRNTCFVTAFSWTCIGIKSHMSAADTFTVIISHLVG